MEKFTEQELVMIEFCINQQKFIHGVKIKNPAMKKDIKKVHVAIIEECESLLEKVRKM